MTLEHEFDSSATCDYCGIAQEKVPLGRGPCPARVPTERKPTMKAMALGGDVWVQRPNGTHQLLFRTGNRQLASVLAGRLTDQFDWQAAWLREQWLLQGGHVPAAHAAVGPDDYGHALACEVERAYCEFGGEG
jgi:hypothetical protein